MLRLFPLIAVLSCWPLCAAEHWIRLTTPHFEMYTTNGEKQGAAALKQFEQVRDFFLRSSSSKKVPDEVVRVVAFRSEKEYRPYGLNGGAFAYYLRSRKVDYIVMQDISPEHYQTAAHEYTHLIVEHLGFKLPVWLNEGLADLYSSLEARGDKTLVGRPLPGRAAVLTTGRWLDLNTLFAVTPESPYYNESDKMSIFYAESWVLTHMLALGNGYRPNFMKFLAVSAAGRPTAECLQVAFGKTPAEVMKDLQGYIRQSSVQGALYDVKLKSADLEPQAGDAPELNVQLVLADLLASRKDTVGEAIQRLSMLAKDYPESAAVQESLGYADWEQGDREKARECFGRAVKNGSKNPDLMMHYAGLLQETNAPPEQILPVLEKATSLNTEDQDAWFDLGVTAMNAKKWAMAVSALAHVRKVAPDRAYSFFSALAFCDLQLKELKLARSNLAKAQQYANTPEQTAQAANMAHYLDEIERRAGEGATFEVQTTRQASGEDPGRAPAHPPEATSNVNAPARPLDTRPHVEGLATSLVCGAGPPRLHVLVAGKDRAFELVDVQQIVVRNVGGGQIDLHCGAQKPFQLQIFYEPKSNGHEVEGVVRELVF